MKDKKSGNCIIIVLLCLICIAGVYSCAQKKHKEEQEQKEIAENEERQRKIRREQQEMEQKRLLELRVLEAKAAEEKISKVEKKKVTLQQFALENTSELWATMRDIQALKEDASVRMGRLKKTLEMMGKSANDDEDYQKIGQKRNELALVLNKLEENLESAYIQYEKFQAAPDNGMMSNSVTKALNEGRKSGEQAKTRYEMLKKELMQ